MRACFIPHPIQIPDVQQRLWKKQKTKNHKLQYNHTEDPDVDRNITWTAHALETIGCLQGCKNATSNGYSPCRPIVNETTALLSYSLITALAPSFISYSRQFRFITSLDYIIASCGDSLSWYALDNLQPFSQILAWPLNTGQFSEKVSDIRDLFARPSISWFPGCIPIYLCTRFSKKSESQCWLCVLPECIRIQIS